MQTRYVDPDAAVGGDGTTNGLTGAHCAYVSLNVWEAARQASLSEVEECIPDSNGESHTADTTNVKLDGWTTTAANYVYIHTPAGSRHGGHWNATKYRLEVTMTTDYSIVFDLGGPGEEYVRVDGIQISGSTGVGVTTLYLFDASINNVNSDVRISNNILKVGALVSGSARCTFGNYNGSFNISIWNNIIYDPTKTAGGVSILVNSGTGTKNSYIYNNTIINWDTGIEGCNTTAINNIVKGSGNTKTYTGTFTGSDYNATDGTDATEGGAHSLRSVADFDFLDETPGSEDYRLGSDSDVIDAGLGTTPKTLFTDDIEGHDRPAEDADWDIGADEYVAAGAAGATTVAKHRGPYMVGMMHGMRKPGMQ